jgi:uncharacterized protein
MKSFLPALTAVLALTGCVNLDPTPDPTRHFTLASMAVGSGDQAPKPNLALVIQPISVPDYLKRSNIVLRKGEGELTFAEFDRWAEPVENGIARVIAENLTSLLNSRFIRTSDQPGGRDGELKLNLTIVDFTTTVNGEAVFTAESKLMSADGKGILAAARTRLTTPAADAAVDTAASVAALSKTLHQFSGQLAAQLRQFR